MKRHFIFLALLTSFLSLRATLNAQESPAAAAERQEAEERHKRMSADVEDLKATLQSCQQRLNEQKEEIRRLNEELARFGNNKDLATKEDFKHLAEKIREVDERRIADVKNLQEKVTAEFARLGKLLAAPPTKPIPNATPTPSTKVPPAEPKTGGDKGYEYSIRSGDNPRVIAQALGKQGVKITSKQITDANPGVDWTKLRVNQKIFIPATSPQ